jgi:hypothetical protein
VNLGVKVFSTAQPNQDATDIFPHLVSRLVETGFAIQEETSKARFLVSFNHDAKNYRSFRQGGGLAANAVLIRLEPAAVFPSQYSRRIENLYGRVISPGRLLANDFPLIPWPYYYQKNPLSPVKQNTNLNSIVTENVEIGAFEYAKWRSRPINLVLVASNKVSPVGANNYRLRRKLARALPPNSLSVYGNLWRASLIERIAHRVRVLNFALKSGVLPNLIEIYGDLFRNYTSAIGTVKDKHEIIRQSKFSLVIENDNNYVSEKLIDALLGGSIPIYFGGKFDEIGIPTSAVVSGLTNAQGILNYLETVTDLEVEHSLETAKNWLNSPAFYNHWFGDTVFATISDEIVHYFGKAAN